MSLFILFGLFCFVFLDHKTKVADWDGGYPDSLTLGTEFYQMAGSESWDPDCSHINGKVKVCNADYGNTRWKGHNEILLDGYGNIISSIARMNEFYLQGDDDQMQYTMCHELGHAWGLPHTDETFGNADLGDCMDYTNNPANNRQPTSRNFIFLYKMYGLVPGSAPYTPPPENEETATSNIMVQNSKIDISIEQQEQQQQQQQQEKKNNGQRRQRRRLDSQDDNKNNKKKDTTNHSNTFGVDLTKDEEEDVGLRLGEPLPDWLIQAMALVRDPATGERFLQQTTSKTTTTKDSNLKEWAVVHTHDLGESHEIQLPHGYRLHVHALF